MAAVLRFLARRLLLTIPVLLGVATLVFALIHLVPGDPAQAMLGEGASPDDVAELRERLGLDRPLLEQYGLFMQRAGRGDLGTSFRTGQPVLTMIRGTRACHGRTRACGDGRRDPAGHSPRRGRRGLARERLSTTSAMTLALAGISLPNFWLGPVLAIVFAVDSDGCRSRAAAVWRAWCCRPSRSVPRLPPFWPA